METGLAPSSGRQCLILNTQMTVVRSYCAFLSPILAWVCPFCHSSFTEFQTDVEGSAFLP